MEDIHDSCVRDETGIKIDEGDTVTYAITGPDAYNEYEGLVVFEHGKFVIKTDTFQFDLDDTEVLRLRVVLYRYGCPGCGHSILETQWKQAKHDYPCPRCGQYNISAFKRSGW